MSEEKAIEIINKIRDSITDNENIYLLCDSLEDIIKNNKQSYNIQLIVSSLLNYIDKLQKENEELKKVKEQSQQILSRIQIAYMVHTKDCELILKDIKKWEKILDK